MEQQRHETRERTAGGAMGGTSDARRGGGRRTSVARGATLSGAGASGATHAGGRRASVWFRALRESVWLPVVAKALGILVGMLALAGVGASSLARGAGVPAGGGEEGAKGAVAAGLGFLAKVEPGHTVARTAASSGPVAGSGSAAPPVGSAGPVDAGAAPTGGVTADGKVILNRASVDELCLLPGVGPKRAQSIVDLRTKLGGRFKRLSDLLRLKGIGPKGLKKIEAKAVLDAPPF